MEACLWYQAWPACLWTPAVVETLSGWGCPELVACRRLLVQHASARVQPENEQWTGCLLAHGAATHVCPACVAAQDADRAACGWPAGAGRVCQG